MTTPMMMPVSELGPAELEGRIGPADAGADAGRDLASGYSSCLPLASTGGAAHGAAMAGRSGCEGRSTAGSRSDSIF